MSIQCICMLILCVLDKIFVQHESDENLLKSYSAQIAKSIARFVSPLATFLCCTGSNSAGVVLALTCTDAHKLFG